jgi:hypothetical protein
MHKNDRRKHPLGEFTIAMRFLHEESQKLWLKVDRLEEKIKQLTVEENALETPFKPHVKPHIPPSIPTPPKPKEKSRLKGLSSRPIHVMIDNSNVHLGFQRVAQTSNTPQILTLSYPRLLLLLQQDRVLERCVVVASESHANMPTQRFFHQIGWTPPKVELFILPRIFVDPSEFRRKEQGVDELLQVQILLSIVDSRQPKTLVLVTGDGNYDVTSHGFPGIVARALDKGWNVELWVWRRALSNAYKSSGNPRFKIVELDPFFEYLSEIDR